MTSLADHLKRSPEIYPQNWDMAQDAVVFVGLPEAAFAQASFLDQRILSAQVRGEAIPRAVVAAAVAEAGLDERPGWIFHIGHVGSTLLSRLVGASPRLLSLREPVPLRVLAQLETELQAAESPLSPEDYEAALAMFLKLLSRSFRPDQSAVIKATSFASELAPALLARPGTPSAILMYARPEAYLSGILGGPNSRIEARSMAPGRLKRLHRRLGEPAWKLAAMSEGEIIAMNWAAELTALRAAADGRESQALWMDFDRFLAEPAPGLAAAFARFGVEPPAAEIEALITGPMMRQYSKAPEHAYDTGLRREVLEAGRAENLDEHRKGLAWLEQAAKAHPLIAGALDFAGASGAAA